MEEVGKRRTLLDKKMDRLEGGEKLMRSCTDRTGWRESHEGAKHKRGLGSGVLTLTEETGSTACNRFGPGRPGQGRGAGHQRAAGVSGGESIVDLICHGVSPPPTETLDRPGHRVAGGRVLPREGSAP